MQTVRRMQTGLPRSSEIAFQLAVFLAATGTNLTAVLCVSQARDTRLLTHHKELGPRLCKVRRGCRKPLILLHTAHVSLPAVRL